MRVHVVDPSAYTPPYDHALCTALARAGARVDLYTSRFAYGSVPPARLYARHEDFYRLAHRARLGHGPRGRRALAVKLAEHVPDMLRYRRRARAADVVHFQWLTVQPLDVHLLPRGRPLVLTAHDVLPREPRAGQLRAQRRLYESVDAVVVHSEHGRRRLIEQVKVASERVHVIAHGVLAPGVAARQGSDDPAEDGTRGEGSSRVRLPAELDPAPGPVVLLPGLLRPYKGLDVLLQAWRGIEGAELWIVGMPRMDMAALRDAAPAGVRFLCRFVDDGELAGLLARASLVVLPYREIDQSGVALTALGAGVPLILSDVGGFSELAATGAARLVPVGDVSALHDALGQLLGDPAARAGMSVRARAAAAGPYGWEAIAQRTLDLYRSLV